MLSPEELLKRCNEVRKVGKANLLENLVPGLPGVASQCLVARSLNFTCTVGPAKGNARIGSYDKRLQKVAQELGWKRISAPHNEYFLYELPEDLAEAARAFDDHLYPHELYDSFL